MDAHNKHVKEAVDANADDPVKVGLEKSGIAGTETVTDADKAAFYANATQSEYESQRFHNSQHIKLDKTATKEWSREEEPEYK